jgi:hypothetical protein
MTVGYKYLVLNNMSVLFLMDILFSLFVDESVWVIDYIFS